MSTINQIQQTHEQCNNLKIKKRENIEMQIDIVDIVDHNLWLVHK